LERKWGDIAKDGFSVLFLTKRSPLPGGRVYMIAFSAVVV